MLDLEAQMAKALEGKFFWEHSRDGDERVPAEIEIRKAQQKFRPKKTTDRLDFNASLDDRVNKVFEKVAAHINAMGYVDPFEVLKLVVGVTHDVNPYLLTVRTNNQTIAKPKHHYYWTALRHFPDMSLAQIARTIGRDHTVIIHSRDKWEKMKHDYTDHIEIVDRVMEKIKCG